VYSLVEKERSKKEEKIKMRSERVEKRAANKSKEFEVTFSIVW